MKSFVLELGDFKRDQQLPLSVLGVFADGVNQVQILPSELPDDLETQNGLLFVEHCGASHTCEEVSFYGKCSLSDSG